MIHKIALAASALTLAPSLFAFDWEAEFAIADTEGSTPEIYSLEVVRYLSDLSHNTGQPYLESAFLNRVGSVRATFGRSSESETQSISGPPANNFPGFIQLPIGNGPYPTLDRQSEDSERLAIGVDLRKEGSPHIFRLAANRQSNDNVRLITDRDGKIDADIQHLNESDGFSVGYHRYLADNWTVGATAQWDDQELVQKQFIDGVFNAINPNYTIDTRTEGLALQTRRLWDLAQSSWIALEASFAYAELKTRTQTFPGANMNQDLYTFRVGGTYYINEKNAVAIAYEWIDTERDDVSAIEINSSHFLTETVFAKFHLSSIEIGNNKQKSYGLSLGKRF